jgi:hypothetical protein
MKIQSFLFFFNTTTMGESQVASSTGVMNPATNNLSKPYFIIAT